MGCITCIPSQSTSGKRTRKSNEDVIDEGEDEQLEANESTTKGNDYPVTKNKIPSAPSEIRKIVQGEREGLKIVRITNQPSMSRNNDTSEMENALYHSHFHSTEFPNALTTFGIVKTMLQC